MTDFYSAILADEARRVAEFPIVGNQVYLAHAGICPLPRRVADAMGACLERSQIDDQENAAGEVIDPTRALLARFLSVPEDEIALVGPTSNALSMVAAGFPFEPGDNVVIYQDDYPSNVYPWLALRERGVEVRLIEVREIGEIGVDDVLRVTDGRTRLVALASCHYLSGFRISIDEIGSELRNAGIAFCVDGIQSVGAFPVNLDFVDFMAADSHKWMLGPCTAGFLYVRREWQERIRLSSWGWHNFACPGFYAKEDLEVVSGAQRFEAGTANLIGLTGFARSLELLMDVGQDRISLDLRGKRSYLTERLQAAGYQVLGSETPSESWGGMVSFFREGVDMQELFERMKARGIRASLRSVRDGRQLIRFSPHFYNTEAELDAALACV